MKTFIIITTLLCFFCSCSEKTINISGDIKSKTIIKSKKVNLESNVVVTNRHELTIQCKKLIVKKDVIFGGDSMNVTIEYRKLIGNDVSIKASSPTSTLVIKKKKIQF